MLHGGLSRRERQDSLRDFVAGKANVLQLKVDGERQMVTVGASLRCTVSEVADKLDQTEPS